MPAPPAKASVGAVLAVSAPLAAAVPGLGEWFGSGSAAALAELGIAGKSATYPSSAPDQHDLALEQKKTGAGGGFLLRRAVGVEDLMHPSLLPDIG